MILLFKTFRSRVESFPFVEIRAQNRGIGGRKEQIFPDARFRPRQSDNCSAAKRVRRLIYLTSGSTKLPPDELEPLSFQSVPPSPHVNLRLRSPQHGYRYLKRGHKSCRWRRPTYGDCFIN